MTRTCEHCGQTFGTNRFYPDAIYCKDCAEELDVKQDGTEIEIEERTRDE